jgi:hypothetical protein
MIRPEKSSTSEATALSTNTIPIYVPLLNEGTDVLRPTNGFVLGPDLVRVQPTADYDPELEEWEFPPGSEVRCVSEVRGGRAILVARRLAIYAETASVKESSGTMAKRQI